MRPYFSLDKTAEMLCLTTNQLRYAIRQKAFPAGAVKPDPKDGRGKLYHTVTLMEWCPKARRDCLDELKQLGYDLSPLGGGKKLKKKAEAPEPTTAPDERDPEKPPLTDDYGDPLPTAGRHEAIRIKAINEARKARIEADKAEGSVIEVAVVRRDTAAAWQIVQDAMVALPERLAADLASMQDPGAVQQLLTDEIHRGLTDAGERVRKLAE